jgi:hypothetical protein
VGLEGIVLDRAKPALKRKAKTLAEVFQRTNQYRLPLDWYHRQWLRMRRCLLESDDAAVMKASKKTDSLGWSFFSLYGKAARAHFF